MNKLMDVQAKSLIVKMKHHLTHEYASEKNKERNLVEHVKEFTHLYSLDVSYFSVNVWSELNELFESYRAVDGE